jgi:RNA polymerase sigma factor (sigma-70 family)
MTASDEKVDVADLPDPLASGIGALRDIVRRVVRTQVADPDLLEDIVQETLARVIAAQERLDDRAVGPYAIVTARNLVRSQWRRDETGRRHEHRLLDASPGVDPEALVVAQEEAEAVRSALDRLAAHEREVLVAHEVTGRRTADLADDVGSSPGAIAAQLNRSRAKLRVEYLLELHGDPPTSDCRPVLLSLSGGDRRRQAELDSGYHLLECDFCAAVSGPLLDRRSKSEDDETHVSIERDADVVAARKQGYALAVKVGFSPTDATVIATAISEIARNIVKFARRGRMSMSVVGQDGVVGLTVVARDAGPGIEDIEHALQEGVTTYGGLGQGLPGSRKLMDDFEITSEPGRGTTVTMTKWNRR